MESTQKYINSCVDEQTGVYFKPMVIYLTLKRKKILSQGKTCMNLKDIIMNKVSQSKKGVILPNFMDMFKSGQSHINKNTLIATRESGKRNRELCDV